MSTRLTREILMLARSDEQNFAGLIEKGWDHIQILEEVARMQFVGLLARTGAKITLTEQGATALENLKRRRVPRPRASVRVEPLRDGAIYLPPRTTLEEIRDAISTADEGQKSD